MNGRVAAPKTTRHLQELEQILRGEAPPPPIAQLLGLQILSVEPGRVVMGLEASARHANPMGTLHGGVICDLSDLAMGAAMATTLEDEESFTTLDLTSKFLKPIWNARLRATGRVIKRTRTLGLVECDVEDEKGSLVAKVVSSCMVLRGDEARGR
ncbi:PaaI family thioesterase [Archangium minus]|uniref:PaaI family thioesterase n=1 Tax=Archangium minus TaxID=83450 RepID=A0ABY9X9F9_9BACT|nr:PaaI family thioesterase [Archangium violaceum]WNG52006.1 PaaI family thioesterase [Archangium minus]